MLAGDAESSAAEAASTISLAISFPVMTAFYNLTPNGKGVKPTLGQGHRLFGGVLDDQAEGLGGEGVFLAGGAGFDAAGDDYGLLYRFGVGQGFDGEGAGVFGFVDEDAVEACVGDYDFPGRSRTSTGTRPA